MTSFYQVRFLRLAQVLELFPVSKSTWWAGVKSGRFPKPVKIGPRTTAWKYEDIHALIEALAAGNGIASQGREA